MWLEAKMTRWIAALLSTCMLLLVGCGLDARAKALEQLADSLRAQPGVSDVKVDTISAGGLGIASARVEISAKDLATALDIVEGNRTALNKFRDEQVRLFQVAVRVPVTGGSSVLPLGDEPPSAEVKTLMEAALPEGAVERHVGVRDLSGAHSEISRVVSYLVSDGSDIATLLSVARSAEGLAGFDLEVTNNADSLWGTDEADLRYRAERVAGLGDAGFEVSVEGDTVVVSSPEQMEPVAVLLGESPTWTVRYQQTYSVRTGPGQSRYLGLIAELSGDPAIAAVRLDDDHLFVQFSRDEKTACQAFEADPPVVADHSVVVKCPQ